jgi:hypothetical protein
MKTLAGAESSIAAAGSEFRRLPRVLRAGASQLPYFDGIWINAGGTYCIIDE